MTKHYCDRCGKETNNLKKERIPNEITSDCSFNVKDVELCNECDSELNCFEKALLPAIANLRISMYKNFMNR